MADVNPLTLNVEESVADVRDIQTFSENLNPILRGAIAEVERSDVGKRAASRVKHIKASFSLTFDK